MKCWTCKGKKWEIGKEIKLVKKCYRRKDKCLKCGSVRSTIVDKVGSLKMKCPCPKKSPLVRSGEYRTKTKPKKRPRYKCKECDKRFSSRRFHGKRYLNKRFDLNVMKEMEKLAKTIRPFSKKYDKTKSQFYSTRDIAKIISNRPYAKKISKSGVHGYLKSIKDREEQNEKRSL